MKDFNCSTFFDIMDERGFPDARVIRTMVENKEIELPLVGTYRISDYLDRGFYIPGMNRPLKLTAYRKFNGADRLSFTITEDKVEFESFYSLNNSDVDPYPIRVKAVATVDQVTMSFQGNEPLIVARYERSFLRSPMQDEYQDGWFVAMEQKITRREAADRYPYSLARTMTLISANAHSREMDFERNNPNYTPKAISRRLPSQDEIDALDKHLMTTRRLGAAFYKILAKRYYHIEELEAIVQEVVAAYNEALSK